jgi:ribosomal-protein-alanine N-acetyltransferase
LGRASLLAAGRAIPRATRQGRGLARLMLDEMLRFAQAQGAQSLWLEVRTSNVRARQIYERYGFKTVGLRRNYYPLAPFKREDAVVMSLPLTP